MFWNCPAPQAVHCSLLVLSVKKPLGQSMQIKLSAAHVDVYCPDAQMDFVVP